jgi:hypothetical protein
MISFAHQSSLLPLSLLLSLTLSACGGSSGSSNPAATYSLSGQLSIATGIVTDSDINDIYAPYASNDDPTNPQLLSNLTTVQGFASARPTDAAVSEDSESERYANSADRDDYFKASLQAGQIIRLQVVDLTYFYSGEKQITATLICFSPKQPRMLRAIICWQTHLSWARWMVLPELLKKSPFRPTATT